MVRVCVCVYVCGCVGVWVCVGGGGGGFWVRREEDTIKKNIEQENFWETPLK